MKDDEEGKKESTKKEKEGTVIPIKSEKEAIPDPPVIAEEEEEDGVEYVKLIAEEGAIVFKKEGMDLIVPTGENSETDTEYFDEVVNTITYMLYALERQDWKDEFISVLKEQVQKEDEDEHEAEIKRRRSHLKVIK